MLCSLVLTYRSGTEVSPASASLMAPATLGSSANSLGSVAIISATPVQCTDGAGVVVVTWRAAVNRLDGLHHTNTKRPATPAAACIGCGTSDTGLSTTPHGPAWSSQ